MRGFEYLEGRCGQSELSAPEIKILALIAADKRGRAGRTALNQQAVAT